jgi:CDP-diglyceride synthetase
MERRLARFNLSTFNTPNFRQRVMSALIIAPVALLAVGLGGWIYPTVVTLVVVLGFREWLRLIDTQLDPVTAQFAFVSLVVTMVLGAWISPTFGAMVGTILLLVLFVLARRRQQERCGWIALGLPYMA